jgi:hypothetical protein
MSRAIRAAFFCSVEATFHYMKSLCCAAADPFHSGVINFVI